MFARFIKHKKGVERKKRGRVFGRKEEEYLVDKLTCLLVLLVDDIQAFLVMEKDKRKRLVSISRKGVT